MALQSEFPIMGPPWKIGLLIIEIGDRFRGKSAVGPKQVRIETPRPVNYMTHQGQKSWPSLEVGPSEKAPGKEEMEKQAQPVYHTYVRQE